MLWQAWGTDYFPDSWLAIFGYYFGYPPSDCKEILRNGFAVYTIGHKPEKVMEASRFEVAQSFDRIAFTSQGPSWIQSRESRLEVVVCECAT